MSRVYTCVDVKEEILMAVATLPTSHFFYTLPFGFGNIGGPAVVSSQIGC